MRSDAIFSTMLSRSPAVAQPNIERILAGYLPSNADAEPISVTRQAARVPSRNHNFIAHRSLLHLQRICSKISPNG
jgi:hypothetical protein